MRGEAMVEKIRPLHDRVLVKRLESEDITPSGIIIPDAAKEKAQTAKVIAVGPGRMTPEGKTIPVDVKVGDTVFFGKYAGVEAGKDYLILREDEILGVVQK
jgi:chaperonin GroES